MNTLLQKVEKLLKKKKVTAHDVGALLIESFRAVCVEGVEPLDTKDFARLEHAFYETAKDKDKNQYKVYKTLYFQIVQIRGKAIEQGEAFIASLTADKVLNEFIENEKRHNEVERIPVIMTEERYNAMIEAAKKRARELPAVAYYCILRLISSRNGETPDKALNNAVRKYMKKSPALNKRYGSALLQPIYRMKDIEFTSLQDPAFIQAKTARAKKLTGSEDLTAYEEYITDKKKELLYQGAAATRNYIKDTNKKKLLSLSDAELMRRLEKSIALPLELEYMDPDYIELENALMFNPPVEYVGTEPETYIKGRSCFDLLRLYDLTDDLPQQIREDYPEIAAAIDNYLEREIDNNFPTLPDFFTAAISGAYEKRPDVLERINITGIAVMKKPLPEQKGKYIFTDYKYSLPGDDENDGLELFRPVAYINCYNALMDLIMKVFDIPEIMDFIHVKLTDYETYRKQFNRTLYSVNFGLQDYYSGEQLREKRENLRGLFPYGYLRSLEDFRPAKKSIDDMRDYLTELRENCDPVGYLRLMEYNCLDPLLESVDVE